MFVVSGSGDLSTESPVRRQKYFQSSSNASSNGITKKDWCCDTGNFSRKYLSSSQLSWPTLTKATSGLMLTFQRWEKNMA